MELSHSDMGGWVLPPVDGQFGYPQSGGVLIGHLRQTQWRCMRRRERVPIILIFM
jgi:hypothetical protein